MENKDFYALLLKHHEVLLQILKKLETAGPAPRKAMPIKRKRRDHLKKVYEVFGGRPCFSTFEASVVLETSVSNTSVALQSMVAKGKLQKIKRGIYKIEARGEAK